MTAFFIHLFRTLLSGITTLMVMAMPVVAIAYASAAQDEQADLARSLHDDMSAMSGFELQSEERWQKYQSDRSKEVQKNARYNDQTIIELLSDWFSTETFVLKNNASR